MEPEERRIEEDFRIILLQIEGFSEQRLQRLRRDYLRMLKSHEEDVARLRAERGELTDEERRYLAEMQMYHRLIEHIDNKLQERG